MRLWRARWGSKKWPFCRGGAPGTGAFGPRAGRPTKGGPSAHPWWAPPTAKRHFSDTPHGNAFYVGTRLKKGDAAQRRADRVVARGRHRRRSALCGLPARGSAEDARRRGEEAGDYHELVEVGRQVSAFGRQASASAIGALRGRGRAGLRLQL